MFLLLHWWNDIVICQKNKFHWSYTLSGCIGKVVASHAAVALSSPVKCTDLYYAWGTQGILPMRVGGATSQLDHRLWCHCPKAGCGWLHLGVPHWAASVHYCKQLIIDPTFCGSRFSTGRLLAIEDFTFFSCLPPWLSICTIFNIDQKKIKWKLYRIWF